MLTVKKQEKSAQHIWSFSKNCPLIKVISHELPGKPWETIGAAEGLSAEYLIRCCTIIFAEYGLPQGILSDTGTNFFSRKLRGFCRKLNIQLAISSSYNNNNG